MDRVKPLGRPFSGIHIKYDFFSRLLFSILYALTLSSTPDARFADFNFYLYYAEASHVLFVKYLAQGNLITNEPLWLLSNILLGTMFKPETVIRTILFCSAFISAFSVLSACRKRPVWAFLILLSPFVIKNYIIHVRQGLAIALFIFGILHQNIKVRVIFTLMTPLIHSSFFVIVILFFVIQVMRKLRFDRNLIYIGLVIAGLCVSIFFIPLAEVLGARQSNAIQALKPSGFGFVLWFFVLMNFFFSGSEYARRHQASIALLLMYLLTYWTLPFAGRIFESGIMLVMISASSLPRHQRYNVFCGFLAASMFLWIGRINQPLLGYAG